MASFIIDLIFMLIILVFSFRYARRGFVKSALDFVKTFLAGFLAYVLRIPIGKWIDSAFMNREITNLVKSSLLESQAGGDPFINFASMYKDFPVFYNVILRPFGLDESNLSSLNSIGEASPEIIDTLSQNIGSALSYLLSISLALVGSFVVLLIIFSIIVHALDLLTKFAFINWINRILGLCFGVCVAGLIITGFSIVISFVIVHVGAHNPAFSVEIIDKSVIMSFLRSKGLLRVAGI